MGISDFESSRHMAEDESGDNQSPDELNDSGDKKKKLEPGRGEEQKQLAEQFIERYRGTIDSYLGSSGISVTTESGGWFARMTTENPSINADPSEFLERGQNESEALFSTFHELEHILDLVQDPAAFDAFDRRTKKEAKEVHPAYSGALHKLYNCLDDVHVNKKVMARWKAGTKARNSLYPKLFSDKGLDMRGEPRHRQLMYALLAESQRPDRECQIDDEVREVIDAWQKKGGQYKAIDVVNACDPMGRPIHKMQKRYALIKATLEPAFKNFYLKDLEDRKEQDSEKSKPGDGEGSSDSSAEQNNDGDPFGEDKHAEALPDPIDFDEAKKIAKDFNKAKKKADADKFKELMGVEKVDFERYQKDFRAVDRYIEDLSEVFERVIQRRKEYRRVLRRSSKDGVMLDPRMAATAVAEMKSGNLEPKVMLDFEKRETIRNKPNRLELTLVCDGSGSMDGDVKLKIMQRRLAVLAMEGFASFRERIANERRSGNDENLQILTELRVFSDNDEIVKPLSEDLNHSDRVRLHKRLTQLPGGGTNDLGTLEEISKEQFVGERLEALDNGELKKMIIVLTDGESNDPSGVQKIIADLHAKVTGVRGKTCDNLVIAAIGFAGARQAKETYRPNGYYADKLGKTPEIFEDIIEEVLEDV